MSTNTFNQSRSVLALALVGLIVSFATFSVPLSVFAQEDYGYTGVSDSSGDYGSSDSSCCSDYGYTGVSPDYSSTDYGYTGVSPDYSSTDYGYTGVSPDTYSSATPDYTYTYTDYGSADYSNQGYSDSSYSTPTYSITNPSYSSGSYVTPGIGISSGVGYSVSHPVVTGGTGFTSTPVYTPTPVTHTTNPTPIVYTQPTGSTPTQTQAQNQTQTTSTNQPIVINNTNTNTNTNTNSAPVTQVVNTQPQQTIAYVPQQPVVVYQPTPVYQTPNYYQPTQVSCSITASPNSVTSGQATILSWYSSGATSAYLSNGIGSVATNGTIAARPTTSTQYVLTVYGNGTSASCNVWVNANATYNAYPYVSLTQIPYTGFDFGPVGDAMYWAALLAFAVAAAYLLVYYRGGAFTLATSLVRGRSTIQPVKFTDAESESTTTNETPIIEKTPAFVNPRIASAISNLPVAEVRPATMDSMSVAHSNNGQAPRIIITRA
ncbi:MAG TPA: hypothetical protein VMU13_02910 [Candidatus Paceibacterota bacterium]|nr:hypothetical protein [Candidatus Paceibacterota bacterium]